MKPCSGLFGAHFPIGIQFHTDMKQNLTNNQHEGLLQLKHLMCHLKVAQLDLYEDETPLILNVFHLVSIAPIAVVECVNLCNAKYLNGLSQILIRYLFRGLVVCH